jgi:hypothetical protein
MAQIGFVFDQVRGVSLKPGMVSRHAGRETKTTQWVTPNMTPGKGAGFTPATLAEPSHVARQAAASE